jgi:iron(III) transport system substrate-binding protein
MIGFRIIQGTWLLMATVLFSSVLAACQSKAPKSMDSSGAPQPVGQQQSGDMTKNGPKTVKEITAYEGADREKLLVENAKKEGSLSLYTSMTNEDVSKLISGFEKKYGIKVNLWRAGADKVLQKVVAEAKANRFADVVDISGPELEALHREGLLQEVKSPYLKDLIPEAIPPHREWVATRSNIFVQAYNTNKVKKEDLPKTWEELADPKWKGILGIEAEDSDWYATVVKEIGDEKGQKLFPKIVAQNGVSVRKGHTLLTEMTVSSEVPIALTVYNFTAEQFKKSGAPVDWFTISPAVARPNGSAVIRNAPHPYAATLFYDFSISEEGQKILAGLDFAVTNRKVHTPYENIRLKFVDSSIILDENQKWEKLFNDTFAKQGAK